VFWPPTISLLMKILTGGNVISLVTHTLANTNSRQARLRDRMEVKAVQLSNYNYEKVLKIDDIVDQQNMSNSEHTILEIHDILESYYKVACKRFVDNVRMQVCDFHLVTGPETPLSLFSPTFVAKLSADELEEIASESVAVKSKRAHLEKEIAQLTEAMSIFAR
jgi:hypothetical protein